MTNVKDQYHHGNLHQALLDCAQDILCKEGGWSFTLRELGRRTGVSHAAAYKHFPDKAGLLAELAQRGFELLREELLAARAENSGNIRDEFIGMVTAYVRFGIEHSSLYRLMFSAEAYQSQNHLLKPHAQAAYEILLDLVRRGQGQGWLRTRPNDVQALACWTQLHGMVLLTSDQLLHDENGGDDSISSCLDVLLEGLENPAFAGVA